MAARSGRDVVKQILLDKLSDSSIEIRVLHWTRAVGSAALALRQQKKTNTRAHVDNFFEQTVPLYTPTQFKQHFRMCPEHFEVR